MLKKNEKSFYLQNMHYTKLIGLQDKADPKNNRKKSYQDQYQIWTNTLKTLDWYTVKTCHQRLSK